MVDLDPRPWVTALEVGVRTLPGTVVLALGAIAIVRWGLCPLIDSLARLFRKGG